MSLSRINRAKHTEEQPRVWQPLSTSTIWEGAVVGRYPPGSANAGYVDNIGAASDLIVVGVTRHNSGAAPSGYTGPAFQQEVLVDELIWPMNFPNGDSSTASRGAVVYAIDENTATLSSNGGAYPPIGSLWESDSSTTGRVAVGPTWLAAAIAGAQTVSTPGFCRAVATNLPAGTFTSGQYVATATGAFSTAQDGVTLSVGDIVVVPAGTIGSLAVSAANSGPYEVVSLGGASAYLTLKRPGWWTNGNIITPNAKFSVGAEGTLFSGTTWRAGPASSSLLIGTGDPQIMPERTIVPVTLAASTATISTVPLRANGKIFVLCQLTGGTPASGTVGFGTIAAPTTGGIGTASIVVDALAAGQTKNGTSDISTLNVIVEQ